MKLLQILNEIEVRNIMPYRVKVGDKTILVGPEDLGEMNWDDAMKACEKLGQGWRLPTIEELEAMYRQLHEQEDEFPEDEFPEDEAEPERYNRMPSRGNFKNEAYWSSTTSAYWPSGRTQDESSNPWLVFFYNGYIGRWNSWSFPVLNQVRPVRSLNSTT